MARGKGRDKKRQRMLRLAQQRAEFAARPKTYKDEMGIFQEYMQEATVGASAR